MGVADFAFSHSVSFRRKNVSGEATKIVLEPTKSSVVAKNKWGQELYTLTKDGLTEYSMRDSEGHAVLQRKQDPQNHQQANIYDRQGHVIAQSHASGFHWENVSITWAAKSLGLLSDPVLEAQEDPDTPGSPKNPVDGQLAELQMTTGKQPGFLRVPSSVVSSPSYPPLGVFLFEAMFHQHEYMQCNSFQRLGLTSSFRR